jgi:hypothetical protein
MVMREQNGLLRYWRLQYGFAKHILVFIGRNWRLATPPGSVCSGQRGRCGRKSSDNGIRVLVRRILRKYGYPPDKQEKATQTVLEQAELLGAEWAENV